MPRARSKKLKCSICKESFDREKLYQGGLKYYCSPKCGAVLGMQLKDKKDAARAKEERKVWKKRKAAINDTLPNAIKKTQVICNKFIRMRDLIEPCISCGRSMQQVEAAGSGVGGYWDAGHYKSRGAYPELRFEVMNIHKQCKRCNGGSVRSAKAKTVGKEYRERLVKKIGLENVEWLEGPHEPRNWTKDQLALLREHFKRLIKQLEG